MIVKTDGSLAAPETAGQKQMEPPEPAAIARHRKQYPKVVINIGQG